AVLHLLPIRVGLIEIVNRIQTPHSSLFDIPHSMVRMQGFLKAQRCSPGIRYHKLEAQLRTERGAMDQTKFGGPPSLRTVVAFGEHGDCDRVPDLRDRLKMPRVRADEPVRRRFRIARLAPKPGETDRYASTNCVAVFPSRL